MFEISPPFAGAAADVFASATQLLLSSQTLGNDCSQGPLATALPRADVLGIGRCVLPPQTHMEPALERRSANSRDCGGGSTSARAALCRSPAAMSVACSGAVSGARWDGERPLAAMAASEKAAAPLLCRRQHRCERGAVSGALWDGDWPAAAQQRLELRHRGRLLQSVSPAVVLKSCTENSAMWRNHACSSASAPAMPGCVIHGCGSLCSVAGELVRSKWHHLGAKLLQPLCVVRRPGGPEAAPPRHRRRLPAEAEQPCVVRSELTATPQLYPSM